MNLLAHAHLSFQQPDILMGNMISDFVKGKRQFDYPITIQKGIKLHRAIDQFTDAHEATKELKYFFAKPYGLYAGAIADVIYDYFLANDKTIFATAEQLFIFSQQTYSLLQQNEQWMDPVFAKMFPHLKKDNWLYHYRQDWGIEKSLGGLQRRAKYLNNIDEAFQIFKNHKPEMQLLYAKFYPSVKNFAKDFLNHLNV